MSKRILVVGAQGMLGAFLAQLLSKAGWDVLRAGRRSESAPDFRLLDLNDPSGLSACKEADLIVSTAHHPELPLERTVLREGGTLIDLIELSPAERRRLIDESPDAHGLVVCDTGLGGVAYLAIADLLRAHPQADQAEYSLMVSASGSSGRAGALFAHSLLTGSSHHPTAKLPFPGPLGPRRCLEVGAADGGVLRATVNGVPVRSYLLMQPRPLHGLLLALNAARLISRLPTASFTAGTGKIPDEPSEEPICEWVAVGKDGKRLAAQTIEGSGYYRMTAAATLALAEALTASPTQQRGLFSVDQLLSLDAIRPGLERHGIAVRGQFTDEQGD